MRKTNYAIKIISILSAFTIMAACSIRERTKNEYEDGTTVLSTAEIEHTNDLSSVDSVAKTQKETTHVSSIVQTTEKTVTTTVPSSATQTTETTISVMAVPDYIPEQEVIDIYNAINDYREENGLHRLVLDEELCKLAYIRAQEQGQIKGHTRPNGKPFYSIVDEYGYERYGCGENIVIGPDADCKETVDCWKNSSGHNKNMLKSKWIKTGLALCILDNGRYAIVQLFSY